MQFPILMFETCMPNPYLARQVNRQKQFPAEKFWFFVWRPKCRLSFRFRGTSRSGFWIFLQTSSLTMQ